MKIVIAPDSFKGSISAPDAAEAIKRGILRVIPSAQILCLPIADGGEGTLDAMVPKDGQISVFVTGPMGETVSAHYGRLGDTAIIEMAAAAGLTLVAPDQRSAGGTTTYGVGQLLLHALRSGCRKIMLTVGGSATNDGGCGMLSALGACFLNEKGEPFVPVGDTLGQISDILLDGLAPELSECEILIATDVKNPLLGPTGATYVYAPQKGADETSLPLLEKGMTHYAELLHKRSGRRVAEMAGCGAGGGISAPLLAFTDAKLRSGIDTVLDVVNFNEHLEGTDAVITGEGKIDVQSLYGKAISGVCGRAMSAKIPVYCLVGCVGDDVETLKKMGIEDILEVASVARNVEDSMTNADRYLTLLGEKLASRWIE